MLLLSLPDAARIHDSPTLRRIDRAFALRQFAFGLAAVCVAGVLYSHAASITIWLLLAGTVALWPVAARALCLRSRDPRATELRNLLIDSALGGVWIALMGFNALPSLLLTIVLTCDKAIAGDARLIARGLLVQAAACVLTLSPHGLVFEPQTSMREILFACPLLFGYPFLLSLRLRHCRSHRA